MSPVNVLIAVLCNFVLLTRRLAVASPVYNMQPAFITANIGTVGRNIRHLPCVSRRSGTEGVCMFAIDCLKSNGTHLGTCIDRFYFGSCCRIDPSTMAAVTLDLIDNSIDGSSAGIPSLPSLKPSLLGMKPPTIPPTPNENIPFTKPTPSTISNTRKPISDDIIPSRKPVLRPSATIKPQTTTEKFVTTQKVDTTTKRITTTQKPVVTTQKFVTSTERLTTKRLVSSTTKKPIVNTTRKPTQKPIVTTTTKPTATTSKKPIVTTSKPITTTQKRTTQKINTNKTTSAPQISQSSNKTKPGVEKPIENEVVKPVAAASVLTTENPFKISTFQSVVDGSSIATTTPKPNPTTTNKTNTSVTLKPTNKPVTNTTTKPKPAQKPSQKPIPQTSQKPISQPNQKPVAQQNQKPVSQQNQKPVSQQNQKPVSQQNQKPVSQQNQKPVSQSTQKPVAQPNLKPVSSSTTAKTPIKTNKPTTTPKPSGTTPTRNTTIKPVPIRTTPKPVSTQKPKPTTEKIKTPTTTTSKPTTEKPEKLTTVSFVSPSRVTTTLKPTPEVPALIPVQTFRPNLANPSTTTQATLTTTHVAVSSSEPVSTNEVDSETSANGEQPGLVTWTTITEQTTQKTTANSSSSDNIWTPVTTPDGWVLLPSVIPVSPKPLNATKKPSLSPASTTTKKPLPTDKPIKPSQKPPNIPTSISPKPPTTQNISSQNVTTKKPLPATTEKPLFNVTAEKPQTQKPIVFPDAFPSTGITTSRSPVTTEGAPKPPEEITLQPSAGITLKPQITSAKPEDSSTKNPPSESQDGFATTMKPGISTFIPIIGDAQTTSQMTTDGTTPFPNISTTQQGDEEFTTLPPVDMTNYRQVCGRRMYPQARIVGGEKSTFGKWPWQISLRQWRTSTYLHKCGAALLNENWAITAAHCVDNVPPGDLLLRLGEHDLSSESEPHGFQERRVQIVASHPQFDPRTFEYDLALLRFYEPVAFQPNIIPVCVPENDEGFVGKTAYVTGWGRLYEDGPLPSVLQEVSVPVINNSVCEQMYRTAGYIEHIPNIFICAGWRRGGFDSCEGDSGGPMVIQRQDKRFLLAGVISWGIGCAEPNQPGVYTRISEFRDWINQILQF